MKDIAEIANAIRVMEKCECSYVSSVPVKEIFQGKTIWEGVVEVFDLIDHIRADRCYAWFFKDDKGKHKYVTVLHHPPVDSPKKAVKAAIAGQGLNFKRV